MVDDIWEYYAKDMMFESHKEPHYVTQQYIKHLEKERDKWRKLADSMAGCLDSSMDASDALEAYEQAVRGE